MTERLCEKKVPLKVKGKFIWKYYETSNNVRICVEQLKKKKKNLIYRTENIMVDVCMCAIWID